MGFLAVALYGSIKPAFICPHCQTQGECRTRRVQRKAGISGGKALGGLLTGGISLLGTGLSRKQNLTQVHCDNCKSTWDF